MSAKFASALTDMLKQAAAESGVELKGDLVAAESFAANVMVELTAAASEPDYQGTLAAARDDVALAYAGLAVDQADKLDVKISGIVFGALGIATQALVKV